ncbi:MAG: PqqD family protein, partial [Clostridia bacterium]|nr:PqqD family protein [Clostridia bacterium]
VVDFTAMITINETGEFIWQHMLEDTDIDSVVDAMCSEYDVDRDTAAADVTNFVNILKDNKVLV